jgi:hypothetical protein
VEGGGTPSRRLRGAREERAALTSLQGDQGRAPIGTAGTFEKMEYKAGCGGLAYNPSYEEGEGGRIVILGQPGQKC